MFDINMTILEMVNHLLKKHLNLAQPIEKIASRIWNESHSVRPNSITNSLAENIDKQVLTNWFSSETIPDNQLKTFIEKNLLLRHRPIFEEISMQLFRNPNLYANYEPRELSAPMHYAAHIGNNTLRILEEVLGTDVIFGVEVGSFIGSSALFFGNFVKQRKGVLMCVDTWCGDINMWLLEIFDSTMVKSDGNPKLFERFMQNMIQAGLTETVIPFRVSSVVAARTLKVLNYIIDFVYLDSAHECGETFMELSLYHDILRDGGVILGDDYTGFPAVKHDLDLFCKVYGYKLQFTGDGETWIIVKRHT